MYRTRLDANATLYRISSSPCYFDHVSGEERTAPHLISHRAEPMDAMSTDMDTRQLQRNSMQ